MKRILRAIKREIRGSCYLLRKSSICPDDRIVPKGARGITIKATSFNTKCCVYKRRCLLRFEEDKAYLETPSMKGNHKGDS